VKLPKESGQVTVNENNNKTVSSWHIRNIWMEQFRTYESRIAKWHFMSAI